jgi:CMP/dCMP kinase
MIITIGGLAGSGTTTASKILSEKMGIEYISAGEIFRKMASEKGMNLMEFSKFANENHKIDVEIDKRQTELAKNKNNLIVEGRLSAYFVESDLKICFIAPLDIRAKRISEREGKPFEKVKDEIIFRSKSEERRYLKIHGIDIRNMEIYDIILNTGSFRAESVAEIISKVIEVI